jgi:hypothetical protein
MAKIKRTRSDRREAERAHAKLVEQREKLLALEAGGSARHPREVVSASLVEPEARSVPCPRCEGELRVLEHMAHTVDGTPLREVRLACQHCGARRSLWFKIVGALPN